MAVYALGQQSGTTPEQHRLGLSAFMLATGAAPLDRRTGIFPAPSAAALSNVGAMTARVGPFIGWADGTSGVRQGGYPFISDDNVDLTYDPGEAGVARIDRIIAQIRDDPYDSSGVQDARVRILKGQASGAATALPASSILLHETTVPAGASAGSGGFDIAAASVARFPYTAAAGGILLVRDATDRATLTPYPGQRIWRLDLGAHEYYTGSSWITEWRPVVRTKSAHEDRSNSTFALDGDLQVTLAANAVYLIELDLMLGGGTTGDVQTRWTAPAGASGLKTVLGPATNASNSLADQISMRAGVHGFTTAVQYSGVRNSNLNMFGVREWSLVTTTSAGVLGLEWAQFATDAATPARVGAGSMLTATRLS